MRLNSLPILILLLTAHVSAQSEADVGQAYLADGIDSVGPAWTNASLAAWTVVGQPDQLVEPQIRLEGADVGVWINERREDITLPIGGDPERESRQVVEGELSLTASVGRGSHLAFISAEAGSARVSVESGPMNLAAHSRSNESRPTTPATPQDAASVPLTDTLAVDEVADGANLTVEGTFTAVFYEIDFEWSSSSDAGNLWSGERQGTPAGTGAPYGGNATWREIEVRVASGRLTWTAMDNTRDAYLGDAVLKSAGQTVLLDAVNLEGGSEATDLIVEGPHSVHHEARQGVGDVFSVTRTVPDGEGSRPAEAVGDLTARPEGPGTKDTVVSSPSAETPWAAYLAIGLVLVTAPVLAFFGRIRFAHRRLSQAQDAVALGLPDIALSLTSKIIGDRRVGPMAVTVHATALLVSEGADSARRFLEATGSRDRPDEATWEYLWACVEARDGNTGRARAHARRAMDLDPMYELEIAANPWLEMGGDISGRAADASEGYA